MAEQELQQLIDGCKRQDRASQKLLYQQLYGYAMKICLRYSKNRNEALEIVNDGFFKAFTNIEKYDENWPFKTWLSKIMYHSSVDYYRANIKWSQMDNLDQISPVRQDPTVEQKLGYDNLLEMVQQLPPAYRIVFNLYAIDGHSHEEIAEMVGISASTSRSNLYKARLKLQKMLAQPRSIIVFLVGRYLTSPAKQTTVDKVNHTNVKRL